MIDASGRWERVSSCALCKDGSERRVDLSLNPVQRGLETLIVVTIQVRE